MTPPSTMVSDSHGHLEQTRGEAVEVSGDFYKSLWHRKKLDREPYKTLFDDLESEVTTLLRDVKTYNNLEPAIRKGYLKRHHGHVKTFRDKVIEAFSFHSKRDDERQRKDPALNRRLGELWRALVQTEIQLDPEGKFWRELVQTEIQLDPEPTLNVIIGRGKMHRVLKLPRDEQLRATGSDGLLPTAEIEDAFTHDLIQYIIWGPDFINGSAHRPALGTLPIRALGNPREEKNELSRSGFHRKPLQKRPVIRMIVPATPPRFRSKSVPNSRQGSRSPQRRKSISPLRRQRTPSPLRYLLPARLRASALPAPLSEEQRKSAREAGWSSPPVTKPTYMRDPAPDPPSARTPPGKGEHPRDWILNYKLADVVSKTQVYTAPLPVVQHPNIAGHMTEQPPASAHQPRSGHAR